MIEGAVIFALGALFGAILRSLPARRRTPSEPRPRCQCGHPRALHDPQTQACHEMVERYDDERGSYQDRCPCRQYVGPEPLPSVFAPGIELPRGAGE